MKRCLMSLIIREMKVKTKMRYYLIPVRMAIIKKTSNSKYWQECRENRSLLCCWWECKLFQPLWKKVWRFFKKLKIELPYDWAVLLLGTYTKERESLSRRDICIPMFTEALLTVAKIWKQPKCPLTDEWIKKCIHTHTHTHTHTQWNITQL